MIFTYRLHDKSTIIDQRIYDVIQNKSEDKKRENGRVLDRFE